MKAPPLLSEHPASVQFVLVIVLPAIFGALTGYILGVSEPVYLVLSLLGVLGGIGAGFDHAGASAGARRGVLGGVIFGASILIAHEIHGAVAEAHLPEPAIVLVVVTAVLGSAFGTLGGWLRARSLEKERSTASGVGTAAPDEPVTAAAAIPANEPRTPLAWPPAGSAPPAPRAAAGEGAVSLNSGSFEDYRSLGMTITQAKRVVDYRKRFDGYSSLEQLDQVPGFAKASLAALKPRLQV